MKDQLKQHFLFTRLQPEALDLVAQNAITIHLKDGESLFEQGDFAERFYLVQAGQIKLYRLSSSGEEKVIEIVMAGSTFAEALMFLDHPRYPVGAQALGPAQVISIDASIYSKLIKESVETCFLLLGDMSQRLRGLLHEIDELSLHSATCRVAAYLVNKASARSSTFDLGIPKNVLASRLTVKPETFSRIIKNLSEQSILKITGNHVEIIDMHALQKAADICALPGDSQ